jgi:hypothetical protein
MHVEMTACYFSMTMPCCRNVVFVGHHDISEMSQILIEMTWGRIKKIKDCQLRLHCISP